MNNIYSASSESRHNLAKHRADDRYYKYKRKTKLKDFVVVTNNFIQNYRAYILNFKELIQKCSSNINKNFDFIKLSENIDNINKKIEILLNKYINDIKNSYNSQYDNILKLYEQKIRILYENKFNLELNRKILDESNRNLLKKEKEYELIKQKTGIIVINNKIINNDRKENEIFILRKENSILKDIIEKQKNEIQKLKDLIKSNKKSNSRSKKGSKDKPLLIKYKLIKNSRDISKYRRRYKVQSLSLGSSYFRKKNYSHPKSLNTFKFDFFSSLNKSNTKSKNNLILSSHSYKNYLSDFTKKLFNTSDKKKSKSKSYILNLVNNIKVQKINDIKNISPQIILKRNKIPNKRKKNITNMLKRDNKLNNVKKKINNSYICIKATKRDNNNCNYMNNYSSFLKKKNNSEIFTDKNITNSNKVLPCSVMKTINNEKSNNKIMNYLGFFSPSYGNLRYYSSNIKVPFNTGLNQKKSSKSFTRKNNNENNLIKKSGFDIKKLLMNKIDNCNNSKIINSVFKRGEKNLSNNKKQIKNNIKNKNNSNKNKNNSTIMNNIKSINNRNNNSKKKLKLLK